MGSTSTSYNCYVIIKNDVKLNGKLILDIQEVKNTDLYIYKMPIALNKTYETGGSYDNKVNEKIKSGASFEMPVDWMVYFIYNKLASDGEVKLTSKVVKYTKADIPMLK